MSESYSMVRSSMTQPLAWPGLMANEPACDGSISASPGEPVLRRSGTPVACLLACRFHSVRCGGQRMARNKAEVLGRVRLSASQ